MSAHVDELLPVHRILVKTGLAAGLVRDGLERRGVDATVNGAGEHGFTVDFQAPAEFDLDWLRPHILPPREEKS